MSAQNVLRNMSLVDPQPGTQGHIITITVNETEVKDKGGSLSITVSPRVVQLPPGNHSLNWKLAANTPGWAIASVSGGGIAAQVDASGDWTSAFNNGLMQDQTAQFFPYTIYLTKTFDTPATIVARIGIDPVIENDPPPPGGVPVTGD